MNHASKLLIVLLSVVLSACNGGSSGGSSEDGSSKASALEASAGDAQYVEVGESVTLTGSSNSGSFTYSWAIESKPAGSTAALSSPDAASPSFTPDLEGVYVVALEVSDGKRHTVSEVSITAYQTDSFSFPAKIATWNVQQGENDYFGTGCQMYNDPVNITVDGQAYRAGFVVYSEGSPLLSPIDGAYDCRIAIQPYYEWVGYGVALYTSYVPLSNFQVDDGYLYLYDFSTAGLTSSQVENVDLLEAMAAGHDLNYYFFTDLQNYPKVRGAMPLAGFNIVKKAFEYCIECSLGG